MFFFQEATEGGSETDYIQPPNRLIFISHSRTNRESHQLPASTSSSRVEMISPTSAVITSENHIFCG